MAEAALSAAQWALGKALGPVVDGVLGAWADATNFGPNVEELSKELLFVKATLEQAALKDLVGPATVELLHKLQDSAHNAEDLLDELDYFRIHDQLHNIHEAADEGGFTRDVRHTAKALGKLVKCFPWQRPKHRQRSCGSSSLAPDANQEFIGCMPKLNKLLPCSSSPHPHVLDEDHVNTQETPNLEFNTADLSRRMKGTAEQLRLMRNEVHKILKHCGPRIVTDIAQSRPITKGRIDEQKLYGRDNVMDGIIHDITKGQYCEKGLSVLPVIGPGGIGKTTLIQHIYRDERVKNHFPNRIWICVSLNFNLEKVLEQIKKEIPAIQSEEVGSTTEELFEQRLKSSKRFLLVLDDIWQISNGDDWGELLSTLGQSQEKGCMILVTTRFPAIAQKVKTTDHPKELNGLEPEEFKKLFLAFIFDDGQYPMDKPFLLEHGGKIMEKLKGSPLAAKTVGRLLKTDISAGHWRRVLKSKQWAKETDGIMPALKLSYEFLPFHLQRCFSYSALFPEDYRFRSHELTSLWIGLDILIPGGQNQTLEKIGLSNLEDLVIHGFFREEDDGDEDMLYVMHDLLHDLALKVASHDCLSLRLSDVGPMEIQPSIRHLTISIDDLGEYDAVPSIRHLTISIDDLGEYDAVSGEKLKSKLEELKTRFKVEHLQTLMLFGEIDENFAKIFGDFFAEANALRVLYLPNLMYPVESMLHNFSRLVHLRYLCLGTNEEEMNLPLNISKIYHLRILSLELWAGSLDLPEDMSNLAKLCHFYTPYGDELHPDIYNVGKLKLLEELKVFRVNKESKGFEPKQLEHLTKISGLGIYNLEKIHTKEEATEAKLIEKNCLRRLTLDWDSKGSNVDPGVQALVLEGLQPHGDLQVLCIRGHGGPSCPTWLGDEFAVEDLKSLCLDGVSWEVFPSLGKAWDLLELRLVHIARPKEFTIQKSFFMLRKLELLGLESFERWVYLPEQESSSGEDLVPLDAPLFRHLQELNIIGCPKLLGLPFSNHIVSPDWFPKLQKLEIRNCQEFSSVIPISWIESLDRFIIEGVKVLKEFTKRYVEGHVTIDVQGYPRSLDQVLFLDKETGLESLTLIGCPPLELKHLRMLISLKRLIVCANGGCMVRQLGGQNDGGKPWELPVEHIFIKDLSGDGGKQLTELLPHLPKLSKLEIYHCENIKKLVVGVDVQQTTSEASEMGGGEITVVADEEDDGVLLFPPNLCDSLQELFISYCPELVLMEPPTLVHRGGWLQALRSLQRLKIQHSPKFLPTFSFPCHFFPSTLQSLKLRHVGGMRTLEPISNLSSLVTLELEWCGKDLKCEGLQSLITTGGQLNELHVIGSPRFFVGWDPNPRRVLEDVEGGEEQTTQLVSSTLQKLTTDEAAGLLAAPICSFFSSSLTELELKELWWSRIERFSKEQEEALQLLSSLQKLEFCNFQGLQQLPAGLHNITSLKILSIDSLNVPSLPSDGLPRSLQELDVRGCWNEELKQQCRELVGVVGTIPKIKIDGSRDRSSDSWSRVNINDSYLLHD